MYLSTLNATEHHPGPVAPVVQMRDIHRKLAASLAGYMSGVVSFLCIPLSLLFYSPFHKRKPSLWKNSVRS